VLPTQIDQIRRRLLDERDQLLTLEPHNDLASSLLHATADSIDLAINQLDMTLNVLARRHCSRVRRPYPHHPL